MELLEISAAEFGNNIDHYQGVALRQPVSIIHGGQKQTVLLSLEEYDRLKRLDRRIMGLGDFGPADVEALERSRPAPESKAFDVELAP